MKPAMPAFIVCALLCSCPASPQEQHAHPAPEKLGTVSFPTSCAPAGAGRFDRAVALLHSFAYAAAAQAFHDIAVADPACAMAHWGVAMSYYHQLWSPPGQAELRQGREEIEQAQRLAGASAREQQYIAAAAAYYRDADHSAPEVRAGAYARAMATLAHGNPKDTEAQVFYALSLIATAPAGDRTHANQKQAAALLEAVLRDQPEHPGVVHYLIHAYDSAELAPRGLAAARAYSKIAPSAPHALHMPSHIYTRLGLWSDSIAANRAARAAAHDQGDMGEELHAMDYLTYAYLQQGNEADAERVVTDLRAMSGLLGRDFKVGYAATAMPVRLAIERQRWSEAAALQPLPESVPQVAAIVYWARAIANARAGHAQAADGDVAAIETCRQQLQAAANSYWATQVEVLEREARAWQLAVSAQPEQALLELQRAADQEDALEKLPVTPGPVVPAREQLGELLLSLHRPKDALREFRASLAAAPGRRAALLGAAQAAELTGDSGTAMQLRSRVEH
jgi:hypothetical protein